MPKVCGGSSFGRGVSYGSGIVRGLTLRKLNANRRNKHVFFHRNDILISRTERNTATFE